ncbi:MAG: hypothetical protein IIC30_02395 [Chloroflexi bacterium]|nr:hypothetical protein [Chloroflexota bacterium]
MLSVPAVNRVNRPIIAVADTSAGTTVANEIEANTAYPRSLYWSIPTYSQFAVRPFTASKYHQSGTDTAASTMCRRMPGYAPATVHMSSAAPVHSNAKAIGFR